jgi:hypothetical protein
MIPFCHQFMSRDVDRPNPQGCATSREIYLFTGYLNGKLHFVTVIIDMGSVADGNHLLDRSGLVQATPLNNKLAREARDLSVRL